MMLLCSSVLTSSHAADAVRQTFELTIVANAVPAGQRALRALKEEIVVLRISSDTAGEVHIHGYRQDAKLSAGGTVEITFTAHATGRYRIEWHPAGMGSKGDHHGQSLAILEVRPRQ